jgi:2-oxoglutarate dehydrogenase complex dehydrogenase (E1) component-like enzyme
VPKSSLGLIGNEFTVDWSPYLSAEWHDEVDTTLSPAKVAELAKKITALPPGFVLHGRVQRIIDERIRMGAGEIDMDWGFAETMAYAGLIDEGLRLPGDRTGHGAEVRFSTDMLCCITSAIRKNLFPADHFEKAFGFQNHRFAAVRGSCSRL